MSRIPTDDRPSTRDAVESTPDAVVPASAPLELSAAASAPDADRPAFVPLALAIEMGMTDPVGTIKTRSVLLGPSATVQPSAPPPRRSGTGKAQRNGRMVRGPWTAPTIPPMDPPPARPTPPAPGRSRLTLL